MLEVPAGRPDFEGEDWEICARRELREETGLTADELVYLTTIYTTPGFTDESIRIYAALGVKSGETTFDSDEFIEPVAMPLTQALAMIRDGKIADAKTICTLLFAAGFLLGGEE